MRRWCCKTILALLLVPSVAGADPEVVTRVLHQDPTPSNFEFCHGGGCAGIQSVVLTEGNWAEVEALFNPEPEFPSDERARIAEAIGLLEIYAGRVTGTSADVGGTFEGFGLPGQLDCIDESTNATTYLKMMRNKGLLNFHEITDTHTRGFFLYGWPHTAAGIREKSTGALFVVDSWFYDNGEPAVVLPLKEWQEGWKPEADGRGEESSAPTLED